MVQTTPPTFLHLLMHYISCFGSTPLSGIASGLTSLSNRWSSNSIWFCDLPHMGILLSFYGNPIIFISCCFCHCAHRPCPTGIYTCRCMLSSPISTFCLYRLCTLSLILYYIYILINLSLQAGNHFLLTHMLWHIVSKFILKMTLLVMLNRLGLLPLWVNCLTYLFGCSILLMCMKKRRPPISPFRLFGRLSDCLFYILC